MTIKKGEFWPKTCFFTPKWVNFWTKISQFRLKLMVFGLNFGLFLRIFCHCQSKWANFGQKLGIPAKTSIFKWKIIRNKRISDIFEDKPILSDFLSDIRAPRAVFDSHRPIILLFNYMLPLIGCSQRTNQNIDCKWTSSQRPVFGHTFWSLFFWILKIDDVINFMTSLIYIYLFILEKTKNGTTRK